MAAPGPRARPGWALFVVSIPVFAVCVNTTAINTALPDIADHLNTRVGALQWVMNAYILAAAAFVVTGGQLGDVLGRRRMFVVGCLIFGAASVVIALSHSAAQLVGGRALQGLGSAVIVPTSLSIVGVEYSPQRRTGAIALWAGVVGLGLAVGPLIGGVLTDSFGWPWVWWANLPVMGVTIALALARIRESSEDRELHVDVPGIALLALAAVLFVLALTEGRTWGWSSGRVLGLLAGGVVAFAGFLAVERRARAPLVHLRFFRSAQFVGANLAMFASMFVLFGGLYVFNLYLQSFVTHGYSPARTGAALLPMSIWLFLAALLGARTVARLGYVFTVTGSFVLAAVGLFLLAGVDPGSGYTALVPGFVLVGIGMGISGGPISSAAVSAVPEEDAGEASGVVNMSRYLGGAFGIAATAVVYFTESVSHLNRGLPAVGAHEKGSLDAVLSGSAGSAREAVAGLDPSQHERFLGVAPSAVVHGFTGAARVMAAAAIVGAVGSAWTMRRRARREHAALHAAAHAAAPILTAHHYASRAAQAAR
jgi:EmrB/QacA subfamily drug resistance transporter